MQLPPAWDAAAGLGCHPADLCIVEPQVTAVASSNGCQRTAQRRPHMQCKPELISAHLCSVDP